MFWNNPAGGIVHHLRALRRGRDWYPFRAGLSAWLERWRPERPTLALLGPSAGYCLPLEPLSQFERFVIFEIDPVARLLIKRRLSRALPGRPIDCIGEDLWVEPLRRGGSLPRALLGSDAALLFTNIIGQLPFMLESHAYPAFRHAWRQQLFPWLERTPWASFHDRVSSDVPPYATLPEHTRRLSDTEVGALYEADPSRERIELSDHESQDLLPAGYDYRYLHWPLSPSKHHLIECVLGGPHGSDA